MVEEGLDEIEAGGDRDLGEEALVGGGEDPVLGGDAAGFEGGEGDFLGGLDVIEVALEDGESAAVHAGVAGAEFDEVDGDALEGTFDGLKVAGDGGGFEDPEGAFAHGTDVAEDGIEEGGMDVGEETIVGDLEAAVEEGFFVGFGDGSGGAGEQDEEAAGADGAGADHGDGGFLQQGVGSEEAGGAAAEFDGGKCGLGFHQVIRK